MAQQPNLPTGGSSQSWTAKFDQIRTQSQQDLPSGAVTPAYKGNREQILELLNRALASEWSSYLQYVHHYIMASDIHSAELVEMWKEHADEERSHALKFNERINQLGGVPANAPKQIDQLTLTPFAAGHDMRSMLEQDLVYERAAIAFYNEIVRACAFDDNETRTIVEDILLDENEHANELSNLLYQFDASTGKQIPEVHQEAVKQAAGKELQSGRG